MLDKLFSVCSFLCSNLASLWLVFPFEHYKSELGGLIGHSVWYNVQHSIGLAHVEQYPLNLLDHYFQDVTVKAVFGGWSVWTVGIEE